ncbi:hypothetical protein AVEN_205390-1 [Araneus ventricosus]|uniref:Uncharacterized protein n=1 Tax=Araneus ventricosus TaxID=182803 RepID=A0A4Y2HWC0_ARAVE|nr:hypothetical protein AVEN_205390-1 [Araneus ventricosus]
MNQRTDKTAQPSETEKMDGVKICEIIDIKSLEIIDRLQQFVGCLEKSVEMYRKETEDWNKEKEEQFKRQHGMFKDHEELWKQMQLWFEQNKNIRPSSRVVDECFDCDAPVIPPQNQLPNFRYFVGSAANSSANSEDEQEENVDADVEPDMEEVRGVDVEDEEDIEEQEEEDPEATGLDLVLEYSPVTSAMEMPGLSGGTEDGKRKGLFCDRNRNSEPWSEDEGDTTVGNLLSQLPTDRILISADLEFNRPICTQIFAIPKLENKGLIND